MTISFMGDVAVTVALRGARSMRAISPKTAPGPTVVDLGAVPGHRRGALDDDEGLVADLALGDQLPAGLDVDLVDEAGDLGQIVLASTGRTAGRSARCRDELVGHGAGSYENAAGRR